MISWFLEGVPSQSCHKTVAFCILSSRSILSQENQEKQGTVLYTQTEIASGMFFPSHAEFLSFHHSVILNPEIVFNYFLIEINSVKLPDNVLLRPQVINFTAMHSFRFRYTVHYSFPNLNHSIKQQTGP